MGIFSRVSDIVNSNINAMLDKAEDPEKIVRLMIQEMEDTLVDIRSNAARLIARKKDISRKLDQLDKADKEWEERAALAINKDREDLARAALMEKAKLKDLVTALEDELGQLDTALETNEADIQKLQSKIQEAKLRQKALVERKRSADGSLRARQHIYDNKVDDALARFDQMERKIDETEARAESLDLGRARSLEQEIADLEIASQVEQEMAKLKEKMSGGKAGKDK